MIPVEFDEANTVFGPPSELDDSQCQRIAVFAGQIQGGPCDGAPIAVTAWKPSPEEIEAIASGAPIFLTCIGVLPPHALSTDFELATRIG